MKEQDHGSKTEQDHGSKLKGAGIPKLFAGIAQRRS